MKSKILLMTVASLMIAINCMAQDSKTETVTDADGNVYPTTKIGTQLWTAENLRTTKYNDGTPIPFVEDSIRWNTLITPGVCFYENIIASNNIASVLSGTIDDLNVFNKFFKMYGAFYNGYAVNTEKLAPKGWHVASDADWIKLFGYLGGEYDAGYKLVKDKTLGFNVSASGKLDVGSKKEKVKNVYWWSSTKVTNHHNVYYYFLQNTSALCRSYFDNKTGFSVRLVKDSISNSTTQTETTNGLNEAESNPGTVKDIDGNTYKTVRIGTQVWMAENLRTTKYRNGELIGTTKKAEKNISKEDNPKYQWVYDNNEANAATYGRYYTWYVVNDKRNIAPVGWHVPTKWEWSILQFNLAASGYLTDEKSSKSIAKSMSSTTNWKSSTIPGAVGNTDYPEKRNASGFNALPGGYRFSWGDSRFGPGAFINMGTYGHWWSASDGGGENGNGYGYQIFYNETGMNDDNGGKREGFSVRCIKD